MVKTEEIENIDASETTRRKRKLKTSSKYYYIEQDFIRSYFRSLVKKDVEDLAADIQKLEPEVKRESKLNKMLIKARREGKDGESTSEEEDAVETPAIVSPILVYKRELLNKVNKLTRKNLFRPYVGDGSGVAKKIGNRLLGYFEKYGAIEFEWVNSSEIDKKILSLFDTNKTRIFNKKSEINNYFKLLLNCNILFQKSDLIRFLAEQNIKDYSLFLNEDDQPKYFNLIFKVRVYDCQLNDGESMTDSFELTFDKKNAIYEELDDIEKVKYIYYEFQYKSSYERLILRRLEGIKKKTIGWEKKRANWEKKKRDWELKKASWSAQKVKQGSIPKNVEKNMKVEETRMMNEAMKMKALESKFNKKNEKEEYIREIKKTLFQFNAKTKSLNINFKKSKFKHDQLVD
jgi:hypothetical protein